MMRFLCVIAFVALAAQAQETTLKVGDAAPPLSIAKWVKGDPVAFEKGKIYVVEFWATSSLECIQIMPHLSELQDAYKDKVTFVGVTRGDERNTLEAVEAMAKERGPGMGYSVAWDDAAKTYDAYMKATGENEIPWAFVVDGEGKIAYSGPPQSLDLVLAWLVAGKWDAAESPGRMMGLYARAREILQMDRAMAVPALSTFEKEHPEIVPMLEEAKFNLLLRAGKTADASAIGARMVEKGIKFNSPEKLNLVAWTIVDPETKIESRDLDLAMKAAEKAVELTKGEDGAVLDTLARVHYWKGDITKAIEIQTKAVEKSAGNPEMLSQLQDALDAYKKAKAGP
jgi:thiol-disulfide isomerase/thioredoxin